MKHLFETNNDQYSCCPTANCEYVFFFDSKDPSDFLCPICKNRYCLSCHSAYHDKMTCKEYQITNTHTKDDDKFITFVSGSKFKQCPKCKYWVEKTMGCDHMVCICGKQFCYKCGGNYGKCECVQRQGGGGLFGVNVFGANSN
jgi:hypothetical protein